jgi:Domain of unknown function (DUF1911)/Domain of unknown function (DUF1910)
MRVSDPIGGPPDLEQFFRDYEHFRELTHYSYQLRHLIARYSRGDSMGDLRREFPELVHKIAMSDSLALEKFPSADHIFVHRGRFVESFRDAIVVLSIGLCLKVSSEEIADVLKYCEHGDPLLETIAGAALKIPMPTAAPAFYDTFDRLYDALKADGPTRERCVREYLDVWYSVKMEGLSLKDKHLVEGRVDYVGYWCFEAAGVVAALDIDDRTFASHPHYPRDLVAFFRAGAN